MTSYDFLQTLPLASNALAIQIIFPLVGVIRLLSAYRVCQLRWANIKKASIEALYTEMAKTYFIVVNLKQFEAADLPALTLNLMLVVIHYF
jgi:uncharacterized membrane protein YhaH (DUF805 family)